VWESSLPYGWQRDQTVSFDGIVGLIKALLKFALEYLGSDHKQKEESEKLRQAKQG
jgi:hypothetical protein